MNAPTIIDFEEADKIALDLVNTVRWDETTGTQVVDWEARRILAQHVRRIKDQVNGADNHDPR